MSGPLSLPWHGGPLLAGCRRFTSWKLAAGSCSRAACSSPGRDLRAGRRLPDRRGRSLVAHADRAVRVGARRGAAGRSVQLHLHGEPWVNWEWLGGVAMTAAYDALGGWGLVLLRFAAVVGTLLLALAHLRHLDASGRADRSAGDARAARPRAARLVRPGRRSAPPVRAALPGGDPPAVDPGRRATGRPSHRREPRPDVPVGGAPSIVAPRRGDPRAR